MTTVMQSDTLLLQRSSANFAIDISVLIGIKCADFVNRSTTTQIEPQPFAVFNKALTKSIKILSHFHSSTNNSCIIPDNFYCLILNLWQTKQANTNLVASLFILSHQNNFFRSWYIFIDPGWILKLKVRKTQEGGLNCVSFYFNFSHWSHWSNAVRLQLLKWYSDSKCSG